MLEEASISHQEEWNAHARVDHEWGHGDLKRLIGDVLNDNFVSWIWCISTGESLVVASIRDKDTVADSSARKL